MIRTEDVPLRQLISAGVMDDRRANQALDDLLAMPMRRAPHDALLHRCWQLRDHVTIYDAADVALAEALGVPLLTADQRLGRVTGLRCAVEVVR